MAIISGWLARYDAVGRKGLHFLNGCFDKCNGIKVPVTKETAPISEESLLGEATLFVRKEGLYCEADIDLEKMDYFPISFGFLGNCAEYDNDKEHVKSIIVRVVSLMHSRDSKTTYVETIRETKDDEIKKLKNKIAEKLEYNILHDDKGWIKTEDKLPNDREWYLGIFKERDTGWINPIPFICDYVGHVTKATTTEGWLINGAQEEGGSMIEYYKNLQCLAWMPMPDIPSWAELG